MGFWATINLIFKYLPLVIELVKKLDERAEEAVIDLRVSKANSKIELIFKGRENESQRASDLNDIFRK